MVQHAANLAAIDFFLEQLAAFGECEQFLIRHSGPEEVRKFAGERNGAELVHALLSGFRFSEKEEVRRDQDGGQCQAHGWHEAVAALLGAIEKAEEPLGLFGLDRAAKCFARE